MSAASSSSSSAAPKASFANVAAASSASASSSSATPAASASGLSTAQSEQEESAKIVGHYKQLRAQISEMANKIAELDSDRNEHQLVLRALTGLEPQRRCYRSIGGVLVERTIAEVEPAVQKNLKGIEDVIAKLSGDMKQLEKDADDFRIKYNIQLGDSDKQQQQGGGQQEERKAGGGGVLA